jgi:hypothetical protein
MHSAPQAAGTGICFIDRRSANFGVIVPQQEGYDFSTAG